MIEIKQFDPISKKGLKSMTNKMSDTTLKMDIDSIRRDIERLKKSLETSTRKVDKNNLRTLINYLENLIHHIKFGEVTISWEEEDGLIGSKPISLRYFPDYNIDAAGYILTGASEKVIEVDFSPISDLLSFELMYKDIELSKDSDETFTFEIIEDRLKNVGLVLGTTFDNFKEILFPDFSPYNLSKMYKIFQSPYKVIDTGKIKDYFGHKTFSTGYYYPVVDYSIRYAMTIILREAIKSYLVGKRINYNAAYNLASIDCARLVLLDDIDRDNEDILSQLSSLKTDITILGRRIEVNPKIRIF